MLRRISVQSYFSCRRLFPVLFLLLLGGVARTQTTTADEMLRSRIAAYRQKIDTAASWHATDDELGVLWLRLGNYYGDERDIARSEEAYARSLKLLRTSPVQGHYAEALDGLGSLYLLDDRWKESESYRKKALGIFERIGDEAGVARIHAGLAVALVHEHRFAEAEDEAGKALEILQKQEKPNHGDLVTSLIARSYAQCFQERCAEGLVAARQAVDVARVALAKDAIEMVAAVLAVGFEEWKNGDETEGERTMHQALELLRQTRNVPQAMLADAQMRTLQSYTNYLRATHQKGRAKQVESEMARLKEEQPTQCADCVVNVTALSAKTH
jgi:tetratricopeptide (TPR) repeat protein